MDGNYNGHFHAVDFVIFAGMLMFSGVIGIYFAYRDRGKQSTENYYFGNRKISPIPVALSLSVSFMSAITVVGVPVEVYLYGTVYIWWILAEFISFSINVTYFLPMFYRLRLNSVYEYLELRFHRILRKLVSALSVLGLILYISLVVYVPSLALSAVTPLSLPASIAITSFICTFYTSVGGIKAVIWTDVLQSIVMICGMAIVLVQSLSFVGGFSEIMSVAEKRERLNTFKFDIDPRIRTSFWTITFGYTLNSLLAFGCHQVSTQRFLSCNSLKSAKMSLFMMFLTIPIVTLTTVGSGLAMYAYYEGCDPVESKQLTKIDQAMPKFVVEIFRDTPGMAGLYVSVVYCGTLSTVSSGVNSLSALTLVDFISPRFPEMSTARKMAVSKLITVLFGVIMMFLAYSITIFKSNVIQISTSIAGLLAGPVLGIFVMGMFTPWINYKGALAGLLGGWAITVWIAVSAFFYDVNPLSTDTLPLSVKNCTNFNTTNTEYKSIFGYNDTSLYMSSGNISNMTTETVITKRSAIEDTLYSISPYLYGMFGFLLCIIIGHVISFLTGFNRPSEADPNLFVPLINNKKFRFGVKEIEAKTSTTLSYIKPKQSIKQPT